MHVARRSFLASLLALPLAPHAKYVAALLSAPRASNTVLTLADITRESVKMWSNSNLFLRSIDMQWEKEFGCNGAKIGDTVHIRLPNDYVRRALT